LSCSQVLDGFAVIKLCCMVVFEDAAEDISSRMARLWTFTSRKAWL
jgi:hypothetical protein